MTAPVGFKALERLLKPVPTIVAQVFQAFIVHRAGQSPSKVTRIQAQL